MISEPFLIETPVPPAIQYFKDAAIASAAAKKKANQAPPSYSRKEAGTPEPVNDDQPPANHSPDRSSSKKRKVPPCKDYEQAFTVDEDVRIVPPHKNRSKPKSKSHESEGQSSYQSPSRIPISPTPPFQMFREFLLNHPSIIEKPIDSHSLPNLFNNPNLPAYYSTDMVKYPLSGVELEIFMTSQPAYQPKYPTYDATSVENAIGYIFHLVTDFFAHRPHAVHSEKEDRAHLFTKLNIVSRALLHTKQDPNN